MSMPQPIDTYPVWVLSEDNRKNAIRDRQIFGNFQTKVYHLIVGRVDAKYIQIILVDMDSAQTFHTDVHALYFSYFSDFHKRKKVYVTFDRVSLYELVEMYPSHPNPIKFMIKRIDSIDFVKPNMSFMIMPFRDGANHFYNEAIKPYLKEKHGIDIFRADDFQDNDVIIDTIYRQIEESEFIIAETTFENKNAFYELGYAAAMKKEIITIQHIESQNLFFDRQHIRTLFYDPALKDKFQFALSATIESIRSRK